MTQKEFISKLLKKNKRATIVGSLGTISKDLLELDNGKNCIIPIKGAMGCAIGVGLGIALSSKEKVIVVVGDGSYLMKMGSVSTVLEESPKNLKIYILNNNCYASTGGQLINFDKSFVPNNWGNNNPRAHKMFEVVRV